MTALKRMIAFTSVHHSKKRVFPPTPQNTIARKKYHRRNLDITQHYFFRVSQLAKIEAFYRLASDWAKKFVMSKSTVTILIRLKHILINISVEVLKYPFVVYAGDLENLGFD